MAATEDQSEMESGEERTSPGNENGVGGCRTRPTKNTSPEKGPRKELDSFSQTTQLLSFLFAHSPLSLPSPWDEEKSKETETK